MTGNITLRSFKDCQPDGVDRYSSRDAGVMGRGLRQSEDRFYLDYVLRKASSGHEKEETILSNNINAIVEFHGWKVYPYSHNRTKISYNPV